MEPKTLTVNVRSGKNKDKVVDRLKSEKKIIQVRITCPECNGYGGHEIAQRCPTCNDSREILVNRKE